MHNVIHREAIIETHARCSNTIEVWRGTTFTVGWNLHRFFVGVIRDGVER